MECLKPISGLFDGEGRADLDGDTFLTSKFSQRQVRAGTVLRIVGAGGGGYGDPLEREPASVLADVRNEIVSAEAAKSIYGVDHDAE